MSADHHDLQRFVQAQAGVYEGALGELRAGHKTGHWMWFIFPQLAGLGRSEVSRHYAIGSLEEARAFLDHPVLGPRLLECADALLELGGRPAEAILGWVDAMKLRSSMTLFGRASPTEVRFGEVLKQYFEGQEDDATLRLLAQEGALAEQPVGAPLPEAWTKSFWGGPMPDWAEIVRELRDDR